MNKFLSISGLLLLFSFFLSSCDEGKPDYEPDFNVQTANLSYNGTFYFYFPQGNTEGVGMKMYSGVGTAWNLINCEIVASGPIVEATNNSIIIDPTTKESSLTINPMSITKDIGYIFRGELVYGTTYKSKKTFYFYVYFSDFRTAPNVGEYNPRTVHYQRFE